MPGHRRLAGINLSGPEFGSQMPGHINTDYQYPSTELLKTYAAMGFNMVRLPFRWERIQPLPRNDLAPPELRALSGVVKICGDLGVDVILDLHNFARRKLPTDRWATEFKVGSVEVPDADFADVWGRLARRFGNDRHVIFGLMNEPFDIAPEAWLAAANGAVRAIRAAGAGNLVLVPGIAYSGAHSWIQSGNGIMAGVEDPADRFAIDVHQYLDADSSGTTANTVSPTIGSERLANFEAWARTHRIRVVLGEFAAAATPVGLQALDDICQEMTRNVDVWLGWAAWGGGSWWPRDYMFRLDPVAGEIPAQTRLLSDRARAFLTIRA